MLTKKVEKEVKGVCISVVAALSLAFGKNASTIILVDDAESLFDELNKRGHLDKIGSEMFK